MNNYCSIGKLVAAFGVKGELVLRHNLGAATKLEGLKALFVEEGNDRFLPYFIEEVRLKSDEELYLRLEGIDTREKALKLVRKTLWLPEQQFREHLSPDAPVALLGYDIVDGQQILGQVEEVIEQPQQLLCRITYNGREALIPLHEGTLRRIDRGKRRIWVELPDGLLDVFSR